MPGKTVSQLVDEVFVEQIQAFRQMRGFKAHLVEKVLLFHAHGGLAFDVREGDEIAIVAVQLPAGGYRTLLGDGAARTFTVAHGLGTPDLAAFLLRDASDAGDSRVYVHGRDYTVTIVDDDTLRIDLLGLRVPANPANPAGMATPGVEALLFTVLAFLP